MSDLDFFAVALWKCLDLLTLMTLMAEGFLVLNLGLPKHKRELLFDAPAYHLEVTKVFGRGR